VSRGVLLLGTHIQQNDLAAAQQLRQFVWCDRLEAVTLPKEVADNAVHLGEMLLGGVAQGQNQADDLGPRQPVVDEKTFPSGQHELRLPQLLEMPRRVGDGKAGLRGERFNRPLALGEDLQDLEAMRARYRLADARELRIQPVLEVSLRRHGISHLFKVILE
jgi:hypothetical protein